MNDAIEFRPIADMFARAGKHLKHPKVMLLSADMTTEIATSVAGPKARFPGSINILGPKPQFGRDFDRPFYGRLHKDGRLDLREGGPKVLHLLREFSAEPERIAARYGKLTGKCCFCHLPLSDERSTDVGYGPVCAQHFGLTWGKPTVEALRRILLEDDVYGVQEILEADLSQLEGMYENRKGRV